MLDLDAASEGARGGGGEAQRRTGGGPKRDLG
jgi:hypothetical protein